MDLLMGKLDMLQDKLLDIERNLRTNENYRNSNLEAAESCSKANANDLRANLEEMERNTMARQNDLERKLDKMEREMMASKMVYLQDKLQDIEQKLKNSESLREGHGKTAEPSNFSNEENLNELVRRMTEKEAFLQSKLEEMECANKARDEKLRCLEEKLQDIEQNLKTSIRYSPSEASTKEIEDKHCNKLDDELSITTDEEVVQSNLHEVLLKTAEVEKSMTAKEDPLKEAVQLIKETENKLTTQLKSLDEKWEEELQKLHGQMSEVSDLQKDVNILVESNKFILYKITKHGGRHRLVLQPNQPDLVYCDHDRFGKGWIVFQHRYNGEVDFFRGWADYREGFGNLDGEFWLGLEHLHKLTIEGMYQLLVEMEDHAGIYTYAKYDEFIVYSEQMEYQLHIKGYSGTAGDLMTYCNCGSFFTKDDPSWIYGGYDPVKRHGAWWSNPSNGINYVNLNGSYRGLSEQSMSWESNGAPGKAFTRMMIRKVSSKN
ncbi:fibrinogen and fibronectin [Anopheles sinensis]|uniref:Fibrinogen C-terminal domain-containing protein n=1 Tax=Anopheles sinensis TaxID=74873 RepID=A0A084WJG1_ANOSI|nr:fibrinogen and fibronectin [Anopheles sinensis]